VPARFRERLGPVFVLTAPPFSRVDLISCRNLLIYLDATLHERVIPLFHFALRNGGYLFLGSSENVTQHGKLFTRVDGRYRIFKEVIADPHQACVLVHTRLEADAGMLAKLRLLTLLAPHLEVGGRRNNGNVVQTNWGKVLTAPKADTWLVLAASVPFLRCPFGYDYEDVGAVAQGDRLTLLDAQRGQGTLERVPLLDRFDRFRGHCLEPSRPGWESAWERPCPEFRHASVKLDSWVWPRSRCRSSANRSPRARSTSG